MSAYRTAGGSMDIDSTRDQIIERSPIPYEGRFGRFATKLGEGAAKTVYTAIDLNYGKLVAWNEVTTSHLTRVQRQQVEDEVNLLRTVQHPNIIDFYGSWATNEKVVFITEIVESGDLQKFYRCHKVKLKVIKKWCRQILTALAYLHEAHHPPIIHRDVKCENILYNATDGTVKIGDLGLSVSSNGSINSNNGSYNTLESSTTPTATVSTSSSSTTHENNNNNNLHPSLGFTNILGTPNYMSPEQYEGICTYSIDIYAFGMCVLEMITGRLPYDECQNEGQIFKRVVSGVLPEAFRYVKHASVANLIARCISSPLNVVDNHSSSSSSTNGVNNSGPGSNVWVRPTAQELLADPFFDETIHYPEDDEDNLVSSPNRRNRTESHAKPVIGDEIIHSIADTLNGVTDPSLPLQPSITTMDGIGHHIHNHDHPTMGSNGVDLSANIDSEDNENLAALLLARDEDSLGSNDDGVLGSLVSTTGLDQGWEIPPPPSSASLLITSISVDNTLGNPNFVGSNNEETDFSGPSSYIENTPLESTTTVLSIHTNDSDTYDDQQENQMDLETNRDEGNELDAFPQNSPSFTTELGVALLDGSVLTTELLDNLNSSIKSVLVDRSNYSGHYDGIVEGNSSSNNPESSNDMQELIVHSVPHVSSLPENASPLSRNSYLGTTDYLSSSFEPSTSLTKSIHVHDLQNTDTLSGTSNNDILRDILNHSQNSPISMDQGTERQILDTHDPLLLGTPVRTNSSPLLLQTNSVSSDDQHDQPQQPQFPRVHSAGSSVGEISWTSYKENDSRRNSLEPGTQSASISINNSRRGSNEITLTSSRYSVGSATSNQEIITNYTENHSSHTGIDTLITREESIMNNYSSSYSTNSGDEESDNHHHPGSYDSSGNQTPHNQYLDSAGHTRSGTPTTIISVQEINVDPNSTPVSMTNSNGYVSPHGNQRIDTMDGDIPRPQLYRTEPSIINTEENNDTNGQGSVGPITSPVDTLLTSLSQTTRAEFLNGENSSSATFLSPIVPGTGLGRVIREPLLQPTDSNDYNNSINTNGPASLFSPTDTSLSSVQNTSNDLHNLSTPPSTRPADRQTMENFLHHQQPQETLGSDYPPIVNNSNTSNPSINTNSTKRYHKASIGSAADIINNTITTTTMTNIPNVTTTPTNSNSTTTLDPIVKLELVLEQDNISNETGQTIVNRASIKFDFDTRIDGSSSTVAKELVSYLSSIQSLQIGESIIPFLAALLDTQRFNFRVSINGSIDGFRIWLQPITG